MPGTLPPKALIGMVHVRALPGTPFADRPLDEVVALAVWEARVLVDAGFDALLVENMHDRPYVLPPHGPEITAAMTRVALAVRDAVPDRPVGVQILSCGEHEALAVACVAGLDFVRCENFAFAHVADEGLLVRACAGPLLRYRRLLGAAGVRLFADVKKKHAAHALTADVPIADAARAALFFGADGVIVTGPATGQPVDVGDLRQVREAVSGPVLVGSGVDPEQVPALLRYADALIVGSWLKEHGVWSNRLVPARCHEMARAVRHARGS